MTTGTSTDASFAPWYSGSRSGTPGYNRALPTAAGYQYPTGRLRSGICTGRFPITRNSAILVPPIPREQTETTRVKRETTLGKGVINYSNLYSIWRQLTMKRTFSILTLLLVAGTSVTLAQAPEQKNNEKEARGCGFLGVYPTNVSSEESIQLRVPDRQGAVINGVIDNTPAAATGIRANDVIISWNGEKVATEPQFRKLVQGTLPGTAVRIDLIRDGQPMQVTVQALGGRPDCGTDRAPMIDRRVEMELGNAERQIRDAERRLAMAERRMRDSRHGVGTMVVTERGRVGATVQNISPQLGKFFGISDAAGALVSSVEENSAGARGGLQAGDVILAVDGAKISDPKAFVESLNGRQGRISVLIMRDRQERTITIDLGSENMAPTPATPPNAPNAAPELGSSLFDNGASSPRLGMLGN